MKKRIYLLLLSVVFIFSACRDNSEEFVQQLFTNNQISSALKQCTDSITLKTCNKLCVEDTIEMKLGYYYYDSKAYRIELPADTKSIVDTLTKYGFKNDIDSLIYSMNRAAEQCGNRITQFWISTIKDLSFQNPNQILHGENSAITDYVKAIKQSDFIFSLTSGILLDKFNALDIFSVWDSLQEKYREVTGIAPSFPNGILVPAAQQMVNGFFKLMAIEEETIRKDSSLWGNSNGLFYKVFWTISN